MGAWFDRLNMSLSNGADTHDFTLTPTLSLKGEGESKGPADELAALTIEAPMVYQSTAILPKPQAAIRQPAQEPRGPAAS